MVDHAQLTLRLFSSSALVRSDVARRLAENHDANGDLALDAGEFQAIFASMQLDPAILPEISGGTSFAVRRTLFAEMLYPSFSKNRAIAAYEATQMMGALDLDGDAKVSLSELNGTALAPATTPQARADALLTRYDRTQKGYIEAADLVAAWTEAPGLGDPAKAATAIASFDSDADDKVTHAEMVLAYRAMDLAEAIMVQFDPSGAGKIDIARANPQSAAGLEPFVVQFPLWDEKGDGFLSYEEILAGLKKLPVIPPEREDPPVGQPAEETDPALLAAMLLAQYDGDGDGSVSGDEFGRASSAPDTDEAFAAWDEDGDGALTLEELHAGVAEIQQAQKIVSQYDLTDKKYFDAADLAAALDPTQVEDVTARVAEIMAFWDLDGDGKVNATEVATGIATGGYVGGEQIAPAQAEPPAA